MSNTPDESHDLEVRSAAVGYPEASSNGSAAGTAPAGADIFGTRWRWVEASCTEGPLDLTARGFAQKMRVEGRPDGFLLVSDQVIALEQCTQTIVQHVTTGSPEWQIVEEARVSVPATPECEGRPEDPRPGEVRRRGEQLEVLVQRSNWCGGLEVRMVYASVESAPRAEAEIVRQYFAHFGRRDADAVAALFAETGSLVEPFTITDTGNPMRHDGREAVRAWYHEALSGTPWLAVRLESMEPTGAQEGQWLARWQYMDPRLETPLGGTTTFTIAGGEIFESQINPVDVPDASGGNG